MGERKKEMKEMREPYGETISRICESKNNVYQQTFDLGKKNENDSIKWQ